MSLNSYFKANKIFWNSRAAIHERSEFYRHGEFLNGRSSLNKTELDELGDVRGKSLLHLQCHFGQDTLSWARLGAAVTGVDFSENAIAIANETNEKLEMNASFICSDIYDLKKNLGGTFDIVFTSYGAIGWLPDLNQWAQIISDFLSRGGVFYMVEFHPVVWMFDNDFTKIKYPYQNDKVIEEELPGSYADRNSLVLNKSYSWNHSLGEVMNALISNKMRVQFLNEFPFSPYNCFQNMVRGDDENWRIRNLENLIPMIYSIKAVKE